MIDFSYGNISFSTRCREGGGEKTCEFPLPALPSIIVQETPITSKNNTYIRFQYHYREREKKERRRGQRAQYVEVGVAVDASESRVAAAVHVGLDLGLRHD